MAHRNALPTSHRLIRAIAAALEHIIGQGLLRQIEGRWQVSAPIECLEAALPGSVGHALQRRLDVIRDEDRRLLEVAALVGPLFTAHLVAAAAALGRDMVASRIDHLAREGHLVPVRRIQAREGWSGPAFRFRLPLVREVLGRRASMLMRMHVAGRLARQGQEVHRRSA